MIKITEVEVVDVSHVKWNQEYLFFILSHKVLGTVELLGNFQMGV